MEWEQLPDSSSCSSHPFCRVNPDLSAPGMAQKEKVLMKEEKLGYLWQLEYEPGMSKYEEKQVSVLGQSAEKEVSTNQKDLERFSLQN